MPGWGKSSGKRGPPYPLLGFWEGSQERKWRKGTGQELEPGEADKCGGEEQAGTQDLGEKIDEQREGIRCESDRLRIELFKVG